MMNDFCRDSFLSTIVIVPDETSTINSISRSTESHLKENIRNNSLLSKDNLKLSSVEIYRGSIIAVEQHPNDENLSNLIIRVPNFQHSLSKSSNSINEIKMFDKEMIHSVTNSQLRVKRRAPICPIQHGTRNEETQLNENRMFNLNTKKETKNSKLSVDVLINHRISSGLRSLSRALTSGCRSSRPSNSKEISKPTSLPDVEVMKDQIPILKSTNKHQNQTDSASNKLTQSKTIEQQNIDIKIEPMSIGLANLPLIRIVTSNDQSFSENINKTAKRMTSFIEQEKDRFDQHQEKHQPKFEIVDDRLDDQFQTTTTMNLVSEITESFPTLTQFTSSNRSTERKRESLSTHRYSTISAIVSDIKQIVDDHENDQSDTKIKSNNIEISSFIDEKTISTMNYDRTSRILTSVLRPDITILRMGTDHSNENSDHLEIDSNSEYATETSNIISNQDQSHHIENIDEENFSESYEVNYQFDPFFVPNELMKESNTYSETSITDLSSNSPELTQVDTYEYKDITSPESLWMPFLPLVHTNLYEHVDSEISESHTGSTIVQHLDHSIKDVENWSNIRKTSLTPNQDQYKIRSRSLNNLSEIYIEPLKVLDMNSNNVYSEFPSKKIFIRKSNSLNESLLSDKLDVETSHYQIINNNTQNENTEVLSKIDNISEGSVDSAATVIDEDYTVVLHIIRNYNDYSNNITDENYQSLQEEFERFYSSTKSMP